MGHNCCVPYCHADSVRHKRLKFYVIPKDAVLRRQWVGRIRNENLRSHARVCSLHFEGGVKSYGEIPSIFPWNGNWERIVNAYNDSSRAEHYLAMQVDPNAKPPAMLTLNRPASASRPCVARQHRSVVRTSTPEKVHLRSRHRILLHINIDHFYLKNMLFVINHFVTQIKTKVPIVNIYAMRCDVTDAKSISCKTTVTPLR